MESRFVKAVSLYRNHLQKIASSDFSSLLESGFILLEDAVPSDLCGMYSQETRGFYEQSSSEFDYELLESIAEVGCVRSPFIRSKLYRDLLLNEHMHEICRNFFPCGYILHLNRSIVTPRSNSFNVSPSEIHRDIPYMYTPSSSPLSLSFLYFFSESEESQLGIIPGSHRENFYKPENRLSPIETRKGSLLVFDSNLLHCSLSTSESCVYTLFMFTSPIIKPVVSYTSEAAITSICNCQHRLNDVLELLGHKFNPPADDSELIQRKMQRVKLNDQFYKPLDALK